jgi:hypothetical protein
MRVRYGAATAALISLTSAADRDCQTPAVRASDDTPQPWREDPIASANSSGVVSPEQSDRARPRIDAA